MADNVSVVAGVATYTALADEVTDGTLGTGKVQMVKIMDGTLDGTTKAAVGAAGLKVDASGAAVPITDNSGSLTVDAPAGTPVFVRLSTGSAAIDTIPITGAVTNAGTFVTQENGAALTALQLIDNIPITIGSTTSGQSGVLMMGAVTTGAPTYTTAQSAPFSLDPTGNVRVTGSIGGATDNAAFTAGTTATSPLAGFYHSTRDTVTDGRSAAVAITSKRAAYVSVETPNGDSAMNDTADAIKVLAVDGTGAAVGTAVAATTDSITAKLATDTIQNGLTALTPKFAAIAASTSGNNTVVAAVTSKKIRVLAYNFMCNGAVNAKWQSGSSGTDLTGLKYMDAAGKGICAPFNPVGWFESASGVLLNLNLSGAVAVGGEVVYVEV